MSDSSYQSKLGSLWVQPDGPNTDMYYLGCHDLDDIEAAKGSINLLRCFDALGRRKVFGHTQEPEDPVTTTITAYVQQVSDYLEKLDCPANIFAAVNCEGRRDVFLNWDRVFLLRNSIVTNETVMGLVRREEDLPAEQTFGIEAYPPLYRFLKFDSTRVSISDLGSLQAISFLDEFSCRNFCGPASGTGRYGAAVGSELSGSATDVADVWLTADYGSTWTATAAQPFAAAETIGGVLYFRVDSDTLRILVARGTTDAGNPAEVAYSDDGGATWTNVNVGSTNGEYLENDNALFMYDPYHIWLGTDGGRIYLSEDQGASWTVKEDAAVHSGAYNAIFFPTSRYGYAVGEADIIAKTIDGGDTWAAAAANTGTGDDIETVNAWDPNYVWIGTDGGELYYSEDGGASWAERNFPGNGTGEVFKVQFFDQVFGYLGHNTAAPVGRVLFTVNGGRDWQSVSMPTNAGLNALSGLGYDLAWVAGNVSGGTAFLGKVAGR